MAVALISLDGGGRIDLDKTIILVGRSPDCDLILTRSKKISRKHCCIAQVDNRLVVRDLGSMNGVWINGERIQGFNDLKLGDEISIGDLPFRLERVESVDKKKSNGKKTDRVRPTEPQPEPSAKPIVNSPKPLDLSQDVPIAIPDEPSSFIVEPSINAPLESFPLEDSDSPDSEDDVINRMPLADSDYV